MIRTVAGFFGAAAVGAAASPDELAVVGLATGALAKVDITLPPLPELLLLVLELVVTQPPPGVYDLS